MVAPNKQRTLAKLMTLLGKNYRADLPKEMSVFEHLLLGVIQEGMGFSAARDALATFLASFHDFNEMRVSHAEEIVDALPQNVPDRNSKAKRILQILQFVFETTYSYDLEQMRKKPLKQAQKQLSKIQGTNTFIVNAVVQRGLGGHALPLDEPMIGILRQLQILDAEESQEEIQATLEHLVPKAKGPSFSVQFSELIAEPQKKLKSLIKDITPPESAKPKIAKSTESKAADAKVPAVKKAPEKKTTKKK